MIGVITWFVLERLPFGVNIRALGGNRDAALGNGLSVVKLDIALYGVAAVTAGAAGILYASRVGSGQVNAGGSSATLTVITAVLIGGVSLFGGLGTIQGVAVGSVLLSLIDNALVLTETPPTLNTIIIGAILVCAVALDHLRRERLYRKR
jgi:ribose/xylose/arabinose/galactoside ABC-type transport system permease subunit